MNFRFFRRPLLTLSVLALLAGPVLILPTASAVAQNAFNDPGSELLGPNGTAPGGLIAVEPKMEAGTIDPGTNTSMVVQFRNESGQEVEFRDVKLFPSSNVTAQLFSDQCSAEPLASGAQCAVVMQVKGLQPGTFRVEVLARHTGRSRLVTATVNGTVEETEENVIKASDVEITPNEIDFGRLEAARPIIRSVTLRNITSDEIAINDLFIDAPEASGFSLKTDCKRLSAGASCIASIVWSPVTKGPTSGALVVQHTGATGVVSANIKGEFVPLQTEAARDFPEPVPGKGLLVASEEQVDFGENVQSQSSIAVSLVNIGDAALTLSKIELSGSEQGLKVLRDGCVENLVLQPTEACPLTISWLPTKSGAVIDDVKISHSGARGVMVLPIRGTSVATVNVDTKPVVTVVETIQTPQGPKETVVKQPAIDNSPPVLDGYAVTSLSQRNAIISGPGGSRMVRDGQTIRLAAREWVVTVGPDGVSMTSGNNRVLLVFDRSLAASVSGGTGSGSGSGAGRGSSGNDGPYIVPGSTAAPGPGVVGSSGGSSSSSSGN